MKLQRRREARARLATLTAYHEAGHAVVSAVLGFDVKKVTIVPDEDSLGHMLPRGYLQCRRPEWEIPTDARLGRYHDFVIILLAGTEAVRHFNPRPAPDRRVYRPRRAACPLVFDRAIRGSRRRPR